ncbi:hypothetical protein BH11PSE11_BH11PSE11_21090 [soil metagenome]
MCMYGITQERVARAVPLTRAAALVGPLGDAFGSHACVPKNIGRNTA